MNKQNGITSKKFNPKVFKPKGFTIVELMVGVAMMGIIIAVAMPSFNTWVVRMRVDNEISQIHRLLLSARNTAVNMEQPVTICPLNASNACTNDWTGQISVFIDLNNDQAFDAAANETMIRVKAPIAENDDLDFPFNRVRYSPDGSATAGTFSYCPAGMSQEYNRGVVVALRGRVHQTADTDNDGKEETRTGVEISC